MSHSTPDLVGLAHSVALDLHGGQMYGEKPYRAHLAAVVDVLQSFGFGSPILAAAGWLHDTLEDTEASAQTLRDRGIPDEVIAIVEAVTDEPGTNRKERKARTYPKIVALREAVAVKLCDRIANVEAGPAKVAMYAGEQADFRAALFRPEHGLDVLWSYLESCLAAGVAAAQPQSPAESARHGRRR